MLRRRAGSLGGRRRALPGGFARALWSDPDTWGLGGDIPGQGALVGADVTIPVGQTVILDTDAEVGTLLLNGTLNGDESGTERTLTYHYIEVNGALEIGASSAAPTASRVRFRATGAVVNSVGGAPTRGASHVTNTPTANNAASNDESGTHRGVKIMSGATVKIHTPRKTPWRRILGDLAVGATSLTLDSAPSGWAVDDVCAITVTSFFDNSDIEFFRIASIAGADITFVKVDVDGVDVPGGLDYARFGSLQYITGAGVSSTDSGITAANLVGHVNQAGNEAAIAAAIATAIANGADTDIDERAKVVNLTRAVVFDCAADDTEWTTNRDGYHLMWMSGALVELDGVESHRGGLRGLLGRYPFHAHMQSWDKDTGAFIAHATSKADLCRVEYCSVWNSANRAYTIHGAVGGTWQHNVAAEGLGHLFFEEDGSEIENTIDDNIVMGARDPGASFRIKNHDSNASGFWISNLHNTFTNNSASSCLIGIWHAPADMMLGDSALVTFDTYPGGDIAAGALPKHMPVLLWQNNESHSNANANGRTQFLPSNNEGDLEDVTVRSTPDGLPPPVGQEQDQDLMVPISLDGWRMWKAQGVNYENRVGLVEYRFTISSHLGHGAQGASNEVSFFTQSVWAARTLNNPTEVPSGSYPNTTVGAAAYHWTLNFRDCIWVGYDASAALLQNSASGNNGDTLPATNYAAIGAWDQYTWPVSYDHERNSNLNFIDSLPMYRLPPNHMQNVSPYSFGTTLSRGTTWSLAAATHETLGIMHPNGTTDLWWVHDMPFFTSGMSTQDDAIYSSELAAYGGNGVLTEGPYYGFRPRQTDLDTGASDWKSLLNVSRVNSPADTTVIGTWNNPAPGNTLFDNMRHFAAAKGGTFLIQTSKPTNGNALRVIFSVWGMTSTSDFVYVGYEWDGSVEPQVVGNILVLGETAMQTDTVATMMAGATYGYQRRIFASVASAAALIAATADSFWRDTANNRVWVKAFGGYYGRDNGVSGAGGTWNAADLTRSSYDSQISHPFYLGVCAKV